MSSRGSRSWCTAAAGRTGASARGRRRTSSGSFSPREAWTFSLRCETCKSGNAFAKLVVPFRGGSVGLVSLEVGGLGVVGSAEFPRSTSAPTTTRPWKRTANKPTEARGDHSLPTGIFFSILFYESLTDSMRASRKGHYSCAFCRSRKLRCDRPLPCTNCATRGKNCHFGPGAGQQVRPSRTRRETGSGEQQPANDPSTPPLASSGESRHWNTLDRDDLLAEIRNLKRLAHDLEKRVVESGSQNDTDRGPIPARNSNLGASVISADPPPSLAPGDEGEVGKVVAHLERVSMGCGSHVR